VLKGPLSAVRYYMAATGSASFGYFGGGYPNKSLVDRIDYSNDSATAVAKGTLSLGRHALAAVSAQENGLPQISVFPALSVRDNVVPQGTDFGYFGGGYTGSDTSIVDRIDYSNDTNTALAKGPLSLTKRYLAATGNGPFGYFGGGGPPTVTTVSRIDYSNDTVAAPAKGPLSLARFGLGATGNASFGYFGGGAPGARTTVDRIDYSSDTGTTPTKGPLSAGRYYVGATSNQSFGYFAGGQPGGGFVSIVDRINYSNDTATASPKGPLSSSRHGVSATGNSSFGYFAGGGHPIKTTVDRIDYSNDTATAPAKGPLDTGRRYSSATGNTSFGYFGGGVGPLSSVDRIDYSNDTATAVEKGPLSGAKYGMGASSSRANAMPLKAPGVLEVPVAFGPFSRLAPQGFDSAYVGGGNHPTLSSTERIDYSNDTATAVVKGPLSAARYCLAATGSASFGYFTGGATNANPDDLSTVDRIDYSNDTATAVVKGSLNQEQMNHGATGNDNFGYLGGGRTYPSAISKVDRIDYSNDTATASPKGPLSAANRYLARLNGPLGDAVAVSLE